MNMTTDNKNNFNKMKKYAIKNSCAVEEMLKNDISKLKEKSISPELNEFWDKFEAKVNKAKRSKKDEQILNIYIVLNRNDYILINEMDILEPWFVKISGINCETGETAQEILNSRTDEPEIIVEVIDV